MKLEPNFWARPWQMLYKPKANRIGISSAAFTKVELIVVVVVVVTIIGMLLPAMSNVKGKSARIKCVSNLKKLGLGFRVVATNTGDRFPDWPGPKNDSLGAASGDFVSKYFLSFSNHLNSFDSLICPSDNRVRATSWQGFSGRNVSYFITTNFDPMRPTALLAGDRNLTLGGRELDPGLHNIERHHVLGWTDDIHKGTGNVVLGDGSVQQFSPQRFSHLTRNDSFPQQIAIP